MKGHQIFSKKMVILVLDYVDKFYFDERLVFNASLEHLVK